VIYRGRTSGMNQWEKRARGGDQGAQPGRCDEGLRRVPRPVGERRADQEMVATMATAPIIFAMANPDPEIAPEEAKAVRPDAIVATGRSDYPNQVNNVLGFPTSSAARWTLRATTINEAMKIAAAGGAGVSGARGCARRSGHGPIAGFAPLLRRGSTSFRRPSIPL